MRGAHLRLPFSASFDTKTTEVLVLTNEAGNTYAIPRETLDRYKFSGEQKAALEQELGQDDVAEFLYSHPEGIRPFPRVPRIFPKGPVPLATYSAAAASSGDTATASNVGVDSGGSGLGLARVVGAIICIDLDLLHTWLRPANL